MFNTSFFKALFKNFLALFSSLKRYSSHFIGTYFLKYILFLTRYKLLMICSRMVFQTNLASCHKLVADVLECLAPCRLAVFVCLVLARLHVEKTAHLSQQLLLLVYSSWLPLLLLLLVLGMHLCPSLSSNCPIREPARLWIEKSGCFPSTSRFSQTHNPQTL